VKASASVYDGHSQGDNKSHALGKRNHFPNDLALLGVDSLVRNLRQWYPGLQWSPRIRFGGLIDIPTAWEKRGHRVRWPDSVSTCSGRDARGANANLAHALARGRLPREGEGSPK